MNDIAQVARLHPYFVQLQPRQSVLWCRCGRSKQQPYCDGSHVGTGLLPLRYVAQDCGEEALLCACKRTCTPPHCDGSHNALVGRYGTDDPLSESNAQVALVGADPDGKARLDGGCVVCSVESRPVRQQGQLSWREIIVPADAGDVIFLPRKQRHSLECTREAPMLVAGVICPGDNPAINYYE